MKRADLEHILRAAASITKQHRFLVVGSQAIVAVLPDPPGELGLSMEADLCPLDAPDLGDLIDGSIGELSPFHKTFGYYAQAIGLETAVLPNGWERRVNRITEPASFADGLCISPEDLAASKIVAWREKDRSFLAAMIEHKLVNIDTLRARIRDIPEDRLKPYGLGVEQLLGRVSRLAHDTTELNAGRSSKAEDGALSPTAKRINQRTRNQGDDFGR
ncbi:uncharacterized protein E1O_19670 [Burkholderiales bacterium GJ-E10]|nr:uncharacterized protein E1O_19670 [Burkholderiales bacterium GJ-E10]